MATPYHEGIDRSVLINDQDGAMACIPPGRRIYVIGDIHGRYDLLADIHARILKDAARADATSGNLTKVVIYLGDYVDRGPMSRETIAALIDHPLAGFEAVHLKGNHENLLMKFLDTYQVGRNWLNDGGAETIRSYGVELEDHAAGDRDFPGDRDFHRIQAALRAVIPASHSAFLAGLKLFHQEGDYYFTHAGVSPRRPLADQLEEDLLWIRDEFLSWNQPFGKIVVHGHSIFPEPQIRTNRIGIDTGAYATGRLTCLILQENIYSFLQTG